MSQHLPPPHNSFLQGVLVPSKAVGRQKLQPDQRDLSPWARHPGPTIPRQQLLPTGAKLASSDSEMKMGMRIKKLCTYLPTPNPRFSSSPASSFTQISQLSIQQFGSSFCLTFSTPFPGSFSIPLAEDSETWDRISPRQGAGCSLPRSGDGKWQFPKCPGASGASRAKRGSSSDPHLHMAAVHSCCSINTGFGDVGG